MLLRCPSNKIVLMELARQMVVINEAQSSSHKTSLKFSLTTDRYSINSIFKSKEMEEEMRRVTMKLFKARKDFDYKGMRNNLAYVHVHWIQDVWVDCRTKNDVRKLDYCYLTVNQIREFDLANISNDLEDDGNVPDLAYVDNKVSSTPLPLIKWSQKESTSIRDRF